MAKRTQVGPIIAGPMADRVGWRNFWWLNVAILGFALVCIVFLFPETKFDRRELMPGATHLPPSGLKASSAERIEHSNKDVEDSFTLQETTTNLTHIPTHKDPFLGRGKPSRKQWGPFQKFSGNIFRELLLPWELMTFPIVQFAAFIVSWSASCFLTLNLTQSQVFQAPPYLFSSEAVGFFNFAILVGALIGLCTAGPLSDFIAARLTKRNNGVREPEMRLLAMVPYVFVMILGNIIVALGYQYQWDWRVSSLPPAFPTHV